MSFYEKSEFASVEKAVLLEDIKFKFPFNGSVEDEDGEEFKGIKGKFCISALTPEAKTDEASEKSRGTVNTSNYVLLAVPKYLLYNFIDFSYKYITIDDEKYGPFLVGPKSCVIPKGTSFLVEFLGGELKLDKISIIGLEANLYE
jgi:hypothetical protein